MKNGNKEYIKDSSRPFGSDTQMVENILKQMSTESLVGVQTICEKSKCVFVVDTATSAYIENSVNPVPIEKDDMFTVVGASIKELAEKLDQIIINKIITWCENADSLDLDISNEFTIKTCLRTSYMNIVRSVGRPIQPQDIAVIGPPRVIDFIPHENKKIIYESDKTYVTHGVMSNPFMGSIILAIDKVGKSHRDFGFRGALKILDPDIHFCVMENVKDPIYKEEEEDEFRRTEEHT